MDDPEHPTHTHRGGRGDPYPWLGGVGGALAPDTYIYIYIMLYINMCVYIHR